MHGDQPLQMTGHPNDDIVRGTATALDAADLRPALPVAAADVVIRSFAVARPRLWNSISHSFRSSAPSVWNDLPSELKNSDISRQGFKSCLKSWLFERAFS